MMLLVQLKLGRGSLVDTSKLPIGGLWHIGFTFFNEISVRGLTSALVIVEATERMVFFFPCRHKNPPLKYAFTSSVRFVVMDSQLPTYVLMRMVLLFKVLDSAK